MRNRWIAWGRALWVLLALNSVFLLGLTQWVTLQLLQSPSARITQGLAEHDLPLEVYSAFFLISLPLLFLVYFIVALLIFARRTDDGFALFVSIFLLSFGASTARPGFPEFLEIFNNPPLWYRIPWIISSLSSWSFLIAFLVLYPDGQFVPRRSWLLAVFGFIMTTAWTFFPNVFSPARTPIGIFGAVSGLVATCACFWAQFWRYRHYSSPLQRQQTKWFVFAVAIFLASTFLYFLPPILWGSASTPAQSIGTDLANATAVLINAVLPIAIGIAILRYRLWDIDVIIRKTLTYGLLSALLVMIYFVSIVALQRFFSLLTGSEQNEIITVASTLAIAALFVPLRNKIQEIIDRRFYRKKYDAQQVLQDFAQTVRDETDLEKLTGRLIEVVNETMQPKSVSVWLRTPAEGMKLKYDG